MKDLDAPSGPLSSKESEQVLRYWLSALRLEEALATRPQVRPRPPEGLQVDLRVPDPGQTYFKIVPTGAPADPGLELLLRQGQHLTLPLNSERTAFLSHWLLKRYRQQANPVWRAAGKDVPSSQVLGFPVVHRPRKHELSCLLRYRVELTWLDADQAPWSPPGWRTRRGRRALPPPPAYLRLSRPNSEDDAGLPFALDGQLLSRTLGVADEDLADLYAAIRGEEEVTPEAMIDRVSYLLERDTMADFEPAMVSTPIAQLNRLLAAVTARLGDGRIRAWPVGLCYDGDQQYATYHLQRDLLTLMQSGAGKPPWGADSPLGAYLTGAAPPAAQRTLYGTANARGMSGDQRDAAERFLGSTLTAVQGPPGTGKTSMIMDLCAGALVDRVRVLAKSGVMGGEVTMVCSTNNRAVDNVMEPLGAISLPLGLRLGSQLVTVSETADTLRRALTWLDGRVDATGEIAEAPLLETLARFNEAFEALEAAEAPRLARRAATLALENADHRLAELDARLADQCAAPPTEAETVASLLDAQAKLEDVGRRLSALTRLADQEGRKALVRVLAGWQTTARRIRRLNRALQPLGLELVLPLPPEDGAAPPPTEAEVIEERLEAWLDAIDDADAPVHTIREALWPRLKAARAHANHGMLVAEREVVLKAQAEHTQRVAAGALAPKVACGPAHYAAYTRALEVREAWALANYQPLKAAVGAAFKAASGRRSLRAFLVDEPDNADWLRRLFPAWGCTLLSLGNHFSAEPSRFERLVIDEAGQCHPAYALSGLLRCERALVIGDVHQLEPVVQLEDADEVRVRKIAGTTLSDQRLGPYRVRAKGNSSAQRLADRAVALRPTLRDHFRCQGPIIAISDALCGYGLRVRTPKIDVLNRALPAPVLFVPVYGEQERAGGSWFNTAEADTVTAILSHLSRAGIPWSDVAVLCPYVGQLEHLRARLRGAGIPTAHLRSLEGPRPHLGLTGFDDGGVATGTVHRFQGAERRIVLFSTVVSQRRSLPFLDGRVNLMNVAVSRAREHFVTIGHPTTLLSGQRTRLLVNRAKEF